MAALLDQVKRPEGFGLPFQHTRICAAFIDALERQVLKKLENDGNDDSILDHLETVSAQYRDKTVVTSPKFKRFVKKVAAEFKERKRNVTALFQQRQALIGNQLTIR